MTTLRELESGLEKYLNDHLEEIKYSYGGASPYVSKFVWRQLDKSAEELAPIFASDPQTLREAFMDYASRLSSKETSDSIHHILEIDILDAIMSVIQIHLVAKAMEWENKALP